MPQQETSDPLTVLCNREDSWSQVSGISQGKGEPGRDGGEKTANTVKT